MGSRIAPSPQLPRPPKRVLLSGSTSAGKSTIFKQLIAIYDTALWNSTSYKREWIGHMHRQCQREMNKVRDLLYECEEDPDVFERDHSKEQLLVFGFIREVERLFGINVPSAVQLRIFDFFYSIALTLSVEGNIFDIIESWFPDYDRVELTANDLKKLWSECAIREVYNMFSDEFDESSFRLWNKLDTLYSPDYVPNEKDILLFHQATSGTIDCLGTKKTFQISRKTAVNVLDITLSNMAQSLQTNCAIEHVIIGGECSCDKGVVVFVVSLSNYDQQSFEDPKTNAMEGQLKLFQQMTEHISFYGVFIVLVFNKKDLFMGKIKHTPLSVCPSFASIEPTISAEDCIEHIKDEFVSLDKRRSADSRLQIFVMNATDRNDVNDLFNQVLQLLFVPRNMCGCLERWMIVDENPPMH